MTTHGQRDKKLSPVGVINYSHHGFKRHFSGVFERNPRISVVGLKGAIRAKYEFVINNRNLHLSSSILVQHRVPHVGELVRSGGHGARSMAAMAEAGRRRNPIAKGVAAIRNEATVHRSIALGATST